MYSTKSLSLNSHWSLQMTFRMISKTSPFSRTDEEEYPKIMTYTRPAIKIGRNAQCPCGSRKKYKHCHEPEDLSWLTVSTAEKN